MNAFATRYHTATIEGLDVFYREAGDPSKPTLLLLHGFPSSSHMFRNLISSLADEFHLVAPDHIGFCRSAMPTTTQFTYGFDRLTEITEGLIEHLGLDRFALYIHDYGAPIGLRIASGRPERITALITQSDPGNCAGSTSSTSTGTRTQIQHQPSSIPGRDIVQVLTEIPPGARVTLCR